MGHRRDDDPSPFKAGLVHAGLSLTVFGSLAAMVALGVHISGNPAEAGPREHLALFESSSDAPLALKSRLKDEALASQVFAAEDTQIVDPTDAPDLGVEYADEVALPADSTSEGVRINGQLVAPGESYVENTKIVALAPAPIAGMTERIGGLTLPRIAADGRIPADVYARPFENAEGKPAVSLIVGGLGINATHTRSAINELPPEVTLSFAPDTRSLQYWINKARAKGHEVLIEVPMEAYDYGRMKMHPFTLRAGNAANDNARRMNRLLSRASGYYGVVNYQGAKLATDEAAVAPLFDTLGARGLAFVEDGSLRPNKFENLADGAGLRFAKAHAPVDTRVTADDINESFLELETLALENGHALGSGYAFPLTIEMAKAWTEGLEAKGIALAPASAAISLPVLSESEEIPVKTGSLEIPALKSGG